MLLVKLRLPVPLICALDGVSTHYFTVALICSWNTLRKLSAFFLVLFYVLVPLCLSVSLYHLKTK